MMMMKQKSQKKDGCCLSSLLFQQKKPIILHLYRTLVDYFLNLEEKFSHSLNWQRSVHFNVRDWVYHSEACVIFISRRFN